MGLVWQKRGKVCVNTLSWMGTAETAGLSYMWLITLVTSQNRGKVCVNTLSWMATAETAGLRYMWLIALH
jgi:hypothetical protein